MPEVSITFLGSGNAFAPKKYWNSILLEDSILLEASPIVLPHLKKLGKSLDRIEHIFISHLHGDHFLGLPFLYLEYYFGMHPPCSLNIIGPLGLKSKVENSFKLCYPDVFKNFTRPFDVRYFEVHHQGQTEVGSLAFETFKMEHFVPAFGYKIRVKGKTIAYSGDTELCEGLYSLARNVDILILEASFAEGKYKGHLSMEDVNKLAKEFSKKTTIILTHLGVQPSAPKNIVLADDFKVFRF